jgi:hypothetical protein
MDQYGKTSSGWSAGLTVVVSAPPNNPPAIPSKPSGPTSVVAGQSAPYLTDATDPDGDQVQYMFDWDANGAHSYSSWTSLVPSGTSGSMSHSWSTAGTYVVKAKAKDEHGLESTGWSAGLTVTVTSSENNAPNTPDQPTGNAKGKINTEYTYQTTTTDADGDQVYYLWDWGDGTQSKWLGPYNSGVTVNATHTWTVKGSYSVKVKAKDSFGGESLWSDPLPVTMPNSYNPMLQLLESLFERFPNAFPILRHLVGQ